MLKAKYGWQPRVAGIIPDDRIYEHILKNRGIDDAERFFGMGKEALHDPFRLSGMAKAVERVRRAITTKEPIIIYGDYDCDGITAISVLYRALKRLSAVVDFDLPDRFSEGYGLNMNAVDTIIAAGYRLVITVDNGITCNAEIARLNAAGIDTIVTDHHEPKGAIPAAYAIVHAKLSAEYPWKELAGVAVSYKLAAAVSGSDLDDLLDLVMIGTIADLMPLDDENQALVNLGLKQMRQTVNPGLKKLMQYSHLDQLNETAIAFKIAPKINSSGRLGKAADAVRLLVTDSEEEVARLIGEVEASHTLRKDLTEDTYLTCERLVDPTKNLQVLAARGLHEGIIGICAQKIAEKYQKTTVVINLDEGVGKGSMRAFGEDNVLEILDGVSDLLTKYGGHSQAAGLTVSEANLPELKRRLGEIGGTGVKPTLDYDMGPAWIGIAARSIGSRNIPSSPRLLFSTSSSEQTKMAENAKFQVPTCEDREAVVFNFSTCITTSNPATSSHRRRLGSTVGNKESTRSRSGPRGQDFQCLTTATGPFPFATPLTSARRERGRRRPFLGQPTFAQASAIRRPHVVSPRSNRRRISEGRVHGRTRTLVPISRRGRDHVDRLRPRPDPDGSTMRSPVFADSNSRVDTDGQGRRGRKKGI